MHTLLGRSPHIQALREGEELAEEGGIALISITGPPGSGRSRLLDEFEQQLTTDGFTVERTAAFEISETEPGSVASSLGPARALLVDDAQWVDATSLAMLRGRMAAADQGMLLVLVHATIDGYRRFAHDALAEAAGRHGRVWTLSLEPLRQADLESIVESEVAEAIIEATDGLAADVATTLQAWEAAGALRREGERLVSTGAPRPTGSTLAERVADLDREERRFAELAAIARRPLTVAAASAVLGTDEDRTLEIGERLTSQGIVGESAEGFTGEKRMAARFGPARRASVAGMLADTLAAQGMSDRDPGLVGSYYLDAARWDDALHLLARAGLAQTDRGHFAEAYPLVDGALRALEESHVHDPMLEGKLRLARASGYRLAGLSEAAAADLDVAGARLSGVDRVHAMGYAGQVADDRQQPQEAERFLAEGLLEAHLAGEQGMLGSLMTLHARTLARLGFAREADAELEKGLAILSISGTSDQQQRGRYNEAWVAFDRGNARNAEPGFARLVDEVVDEGIVFADRLAWWSRALFLAGRPDEALDARRRSIERADIDAGPVFLAHMALAEGAIRCGAWSDALDAADKTLALVLQQLPAWENSARYLRARALFGLGRIDEADTETEAALASCPEGVNGRRWWLKIRVLQLAIIAARGDDWPSDEAFDMTDELLQSEWYLTAATLLVTRSAVERDPSLAAEAMALATQLGVSDVAAEAAQTGGLWRRPEAGAVATSIKTLSSHMPDDWREAWEALPHVSSALSVPDIDEAAYREAVDRLSTQLDDALEAAGLGTEGRLVSPAQRRARGLRRPRRPFRWTPLRAVAAVFGVAILVVGGGFLFRALSPTSATAPIIRLTGPNLQTIQVGDAYVELGATATDNHDGDLTTSIVIDDSAVDTSTVGIYVVTYDVTDSEGNPAQVTRTVHVVDTTQTPEIWEVDLGPPEKNVVVGQWDFSGGVEASAATNAGAANRTGVRKAEGYYWKYTAGGRIESSPAVFGENVIFGSEDGTLYGIAMASGVPPFWNDPSPNEGLVGSPTLAFQASGSNLVESATRVYYGSKDGVLRVRDAGSQTAPVDRVPGEGQLEGQIVSAPVVVGDTVYVGTTAGLLYAISTSVPFDERWHVDLESPIRTSPAFADGVLYVGTEAGVLWEIEEETGDVACHYDTHDTIASPPVIAGDTVFIPARDAQTLLAVRKGSCVPEASILLSATVASSPAYADGVLYVAVGSYVWAYDADTRQPIWQYPASDSGSHLGGAAGWPVVANGILYFTTDEPFMYAIDIESHELLWRYKLDGSVVSRPAIMDGAVVVGDVSGTIVAIGCTNPPDCK
jgi:outer membrane protein assembly factor BamB/tetratricopeptide (TPR) repeat protein